MNDKDSALEEYKMLRSEIELKMQMINSLTIAMVTAVSACVVAGVQFKKRYIFLVGILFLYPISQKILYYMQGIERISSYLIVFLESKIDIKWESRNRKLVHVARHYSGQNYSSRSFASFALYCVMAAVWFIYSWNIGSIAIYCNGHFILANVFYWIILVISGILFSVQTVKMKNINGQDVKTKYELVWKEIMKDGEEE